MAHLFLGSGVATGGRGGMVSISVGSGTSGSGGAVSMLSGRSTVHTGGALSLESGEGHGDRQRPHLDSHCELRHGWRERAPGVQLWLGRRREQRRFVSRFGRGYWRPGRHGEHQRRQRHERIWRCGERAVGSQHCAKRWAH